MNCRETESARSSAAPFAPRCCPASASPMDRGRGSNHASSARSPPRLRPEPTGIPPNTETPMPTMHAIRTPRFGGPESMIHVTVERPVPGPHQLLVKVAAIGVNRADVMQRSGTYSPPAGESDILGLELSGDVVATGSEVSRFRSGQRVFGLVAAGAYAEYALVHEQLAVEIPETWNYVQAAAVIEMFCTANETLFTLGELKAGERVLVHAAGSGIGSTAIQMA